MKKKRIFLFHTCPWWSSAQIYDTVNCQRGDKSARVVRGKDPSLPSVLEELHGSSGIKEKKFLKILCGIRSCEEEFSVLFKTFKLIAKHYKDIPTLCVKKTNV